jgi:Na+-translocating ferredoxin:NAD+ oxidoreductase RnfE subunit
MKKISVVIATVASVIALSPAAYAEQCYQVARAFAPNMMKCQQVGQTNMGTPIWLCCD